jgi:hypothetical protein
MYSIISGMIKEQNQGLALELGGFQFKPRINQTSLDLSSTMKALHLRMPEMINEKKKSDEAKRKDKELVICVRVLFMLLVESFLP